MNAKAQLSEIIEAMDENEAIKLLASVKRSLKPRTWDAVPKVNPSAEERRIIFEFHASDDYAEFKKLSQEANTKPDETLAKV